MKLNARQLRDVDEKTISAEVKKIARKPMYFILENIYDTYNIGGLFRLADALAVEKMFICGETEIPPNPKIKKSSIGTYKVVPWEYRKTAGEAIKELRKAFNVERITQENKKGNSLHTMRDSLRIFAVEQAQNSISYSQAEYSFPVALIFGNETYGVLPGTLALADQIVEIPMWGINRSLNVIVSAAIVSYWIAALENRSTVTGK